MFKKFNKKICVFTVCLALCLATFCCSVPVGAANSDTMRYFGTDTVRNNIGFMLGNSSGIYSLARVRGGSYRTAEYYYAGGQNEMRFFVTDKYQPFEEEFLPPGYSGPPERHNWANQLLSLEIQCEVPSFSGNSIYIGNYALPVVDKLSFDFSAYGSQLYFTSADVYGNPAFSSIETSDSLGYRFVGLEVKVDYLLYAFEEDAYGNNWREKSVTDYVKVSSDTVHNLSNASNVFAQNYMTNAVGGYYNLEFSRPVAIKKVTLIPVFQSFCTNPTVNLINWEDELISESTKVWMSKVSACFCVSNVMYFGGYSKSNFNVYNELGENGDFTAVIIEGNLALKNIFDGVSANENFESVVEKNSNAFNLIGQVVTKLFSFSIFNEIVVITCSLSVIGAFVGFGVILKRKKGGGD